MKEIKKTIQKIFRKIIKNYQECMSQYGEALLRGGSYGCA